MRMASTALVTAMAVAVLAAGGGAGARSTPPQAGAATPLPPQAIGFPSRAPDFDALPGFRNPPPGYGEVAFYWWMGDPLTKERLAWQLDRLAGSGVTGLQINYAHSDRGGRAWGLTYPSDPPLFSRGWWELTSWFLKEARRRGMSVSLSDYTLGIGQGWVVDEILRDHPGLTGRELRHEVREAAGGDVRWPLPDDTLMVGAYDAVSGRAVDLRPNVANGVLEWHAPHGGWQIVAVFARPVVPSIDPMNPLSGSEYVKRFFGRWEEHNPGEAGKGLNFFFSDELDFGVSGNLWTPSFAEQFRRRKGYDLVPDLPALFVDAGPRTPKVRLDYRDVMVALEEEAFFRPVFDWHQQRGMIFGCDHGGRGRDVAEFGDYFRTQRWNQGPGSDQPNLSRDVIKAKVASSIAHLYQRPRVWLEGFHSSGWGTTLAQLADATFANFAAGYNLLTLHGLYYSTHGGWWEWAPPDNHLHMPYWPHTAEFLRAVQRLSFVMSQGDHRCDVAILYPVAAVEAGMDGEASVRAAFDAGRQLYSRGIDFDFMDFESLARAEVTGRALRVGGEVYRVLVLPAMRAARFSTVEKAVEFQRAGGLVILLGAAPEASDRAGRDDARLNALVAELRTRVANATELQALVEGAFPRDYSGPGAVMHRRIGARDLYMVYGAARGAACDFRATGRAELWDPWTGAVRPLATATRTAGLTRVSMPLSETEPQLIVFGPGDPVKAGSPEASGDAASRFDAANAETRIPIEGDWEFELKPVLDNRWGDYRWPPSPEVIGAEVRWFRHAVERGAEPGWQAPKLDDSSWQVVTASFGPRFWKLGPLPADLAADGLVGLDRVEPSTPVTHGGREYRWTPYGFSWRWGVEDDPGHQGYHGLKENVPDEFIALGRRKQTDTGTTYESEEGGARYFLWTSVAADVAGPARLLTGGNVPTAIWLNHQRVGGAGGIVDIERSSNPLLLQYDGVGRGYVVIDREVGRDAAAPPAFDPSAFGVSPLAMFWYRRPGVLPFDCQPGRAAAGWYRFVSPPGLRGLTVPTRGAVRAWADGHDMRDAGGGRFVVSRVSALPVTVALRVEPRRGSYGGAAFDDAIRLECVPGSMPPGDWSQNDGLANYSGGAWYRKTVTIPAARRVVLDLGRVVSSAEVRVNGRPAGIRVTPPWTFDVSRLVEPGPNRIEVLIYNTLANHYGTIPTRYRGQPTSGLLGPVALRLTPSR
jgi:hypothetical protein